MEDMLLVLSYLVVFAIGVGLRIVYVEYLRYRIRGWLGIDEDLEEWYEEVYRLSVGMQDIIQEQDFYAGGEVSDEAITTYRKLRPKLAARPSGVNFKTADHGKRIKNAFRDAREAKPDENIDEELLTHLAWLQQSIEEESEILNG